MLASAKFRLNIGQKIYERSQIRSDSCNITNNMTSLSLVFMESVKSPGLAICKPANIPKAKDSNDAFALG